MSAEPDGFEEFRRVRDLNAKRDEAFAVLLAACEYIGNHKSGNLHGFHGDVVAIARRGVKAAGGELRAVGWFAEGEAVKMTHAERQRGKAERFFAKMKAEGQVWNNFREHWTSAALHKEDEAAHAGAGI